MGAWLSCMNMSQNTHRRHPRVKGKLKNKTFSHSIYIYVGILIYRSYLHEARDSGENHKAGQTEFAVYRHRPHGFSDFPKIFQISDTMQ